MVAEFLEKAQETYHECSKYSYFVEEALFKFEEDYETLSDNFFIKACNHKTFQYGAIEVEGSDLGLWFSGYHTLFCQELGLKLVKIIRTSVCGTKRDQYTLTYTFKSNPRQEELSLDKVKEWLD